MLLYATLPALLACSGVVSSAPAPDTGGAASSLDASSKAFAATVAYQEMCYLTLFDAADFTSLKYGKDILAKDEKGQNVYISDGYKKDSNGKEYYYEEACYKSSKVDGKTRSNTVASSSTTSSSPFSSIIGGLGLDDGVSGFLSGLVSGDSLGLGGLVRFVKRQFDGKTIGAIIGQPAAEPAASSSSSVAAPTTDEESATPYSPDFFDAPSPSPTPTPTTTAAPSPTAVDPLQIANGFGGIQTVGNALPGRIGAKDILGPAFSSATPTSASFGAVTTGANLQPTQADSPQVNTHAMQPSTSAFTPAPGPPGYSSAFTPADGPPPSSPPPAVVNSNSDDAAAAQPTQFQPATPPIVQTRASTFTPAPPPTTQDATASMNNVVSPPTAPEVQPTPSSSVVQTAAPPVNSAPSFFTAASSVVTPTVPATSPAVAVDTPAPSSTPTPSSAIVDTPATSSSTVPLRIYVAPASPSSSSVGTVSTTSTMPAVVSLAPTAVPAQSAK
ncbi:proteophosphoglycan 5 [Rhodotorula toruloides]|uniref:Proteophosphoglycan 5 n=1 Tax=Rhodotorula toruloides TaxID=5286 RepID=A0A511KFB7_RHOTO|nr:proteophosphoglycan 5 [Rhodotorula toruloides]